MIRIGIVDDEEIMRLKIHQCIKEILKEQESVEIRSYDCAEDFLEEVQKKTHFDILFSDIQMLEMNGLELGKRLQKDMPNLYIIYITAYMEYAVESYKISAYQYILKEDMEIRLPQITRKLLNQIQHEYAQFRVVGTNGIQKKIYFRDIIYVYKGKETKYELRLIPLGGFVRLEGEDTKSEDERAFNNASIPKRMAIVAAGATVNIVFGILVYFIIMASIGNNVSTVVDSTIPDFTAEQAGIYAGDKIEKIKSMFKS